MANRDYFSRPNQGNGRDHQSYGLTKLSHEAKRYNAVGPFGWLCVALIVAYFVWQFCR